MEFFKREKGATVVLVALTIVVLIGFTALAVDGGYLYYRHTQYQDLADAIALAAAKDYVGGQTQVISTAKEYAGKNGLTVGSASGHTAQVTNANGETGYMDVTFPNGNVKVDLDINSQLFFARIFGHNSSPVAAAATVGTEMLATYGAGLVPIGVVDSTTFQPDVPVTLSYGPSTGYNGNFGFVNLDSYLPPNSTGTNNAGTTEFSDYLQSGYDGSQTFSVNGSINTITGEKVGQVDQAITGGGLPRTIMVPLITTLVDATGVERITITGFAEFLLTGYDAHDKLVTGNFIRKIDVGTGISGSSPAAVKTLKLIQ